MKNEHETPRSARTYHRQIEEALNDSFQRRTLDKFAVEYRASRDKVFEEIDGRGLIRQIADMKDDAARHIEELYARFKSTLSHRPYRAVRNVDIFFYKSDIHGVPGLYPQYPQYPQFSPVCSPL